MPARNEGHDGEFLVGVFRIVGFSQSDEQITNVNSYVVPKNSREPLPLQFVVRGELVETKHTYGIPPGAEFSLAYKIPPSDRRNIQGVSVEEYLAEYGGFEFIFEYGDGDRETHTVSFTSVREMLLRVKKLKDNAKRPPPAVVRKH